MENTKIYHLSIPTAVEGDNQNLLLVKSCKDKYGIYNCPKQGAFYSVIESDMSRFLGLFKDNEPVEIDISDKSLECSINDLVDFLSKSKERTSPVRLGDLESVINF